MPSISTINEHIPSISNINEPAVLQHLYKEL